MYNGTHRPSRLSYYMKFNASDTTSGPTPNQKRNTKVGGGDGDGWRVLVALHSADYGRRTRGGYNGLC